jgi:hypothetical protein
MVINRMVRLEVAEVSDGGEVQIIYQKEGTAENIAANNVGNFHFQPVIALVD